MSKENKLPPPSEEFKNAVGNAGSIEIMCELCGRDHFSSDKGSFEEGEYETLVENSLREPDKYIHHSDDSVSWGYVNGKRAVVDCPCNKLSQYEDLFWNSKHIISEYFSARAEKELRIAQNNKNIADKLKDSIK